MAGGALNGLKVIELASEHAAFAGKLLAELGADVVLVEPPDGHRTRSFGPFAKGHQSAETSLWWWTYHTSKRAVTLDLESRTGGREFARLVGTADIVLEAEPAGRLEQLGIGYSAFAALPSVVWVSVSPFGSATSRADVPATDLTILAAGGPLWSCGYDDHALPPTRCEGNQALHTASIYAVMAALTAILERSRSGQGQYVDVSSVAASNVTTETATLFWTVSRQTVQRQTGRHAAVVPTGETYARAADGRWVHTGTLPRRAAEFQGLIRWLDELCLTEELPERVFLDMAVQRGEISLGEIGHDPIVTAIANASRDALYLIASQLSGQDFFAESQRHGLQAGVVNSIADVFDDAHFRARGFFVDVEVPEAGGPVEFPGPPFRMTSTPWRIAGPAPRLGQHNAEVLRPAHGDASAVSVIE